MIFLYSIFVFWGPIISAFLPTSFGNINLIWAIFFVLIMAFLLWQILRQKKIRLFNLWLCFVVTFCIVEVSSVAWSAHYYYNVEIIKVLFARYIAPVIVTFIALNLFDSESQYRKAIKYLLSAALFLSLFALAQVTFGFQTLFSPLNTFETYRASGTFQNANGLAIFLVLTIPHLLYGISCNAISKKIGWSCIAIIFIGILCTVSRKGIITAWLVLLLYFILRKDFKKIVKLCFVTIVAVTILSGYMFVAQRFTEKKLVAEFAGKYAMSVAGVDMFLKNPFIGLGVCRT